MTWSSKLATSIDDALAFLKDTATYLSLESVAYLCIWKKYHLNSIFYKHRNQQEFVAKNRKQWMVEKEQIKDKVINRIL